MDYERPLELNVSLHTYIHIYKHTTFISNDLHDMAFMTKSQYKKMW